MNEEQVTSRRRFLGTAAGATGVALAAAVWKPAQAAAAVPEQGPRHPSPIRSYVSGNFFLQLEGIKAGFLKAVDGGNITAEVVEEPVGSTYYAQKHIGNPKYEDLSLQLGLGMNKAVYSWISAQWTGQAQRKSGAVIAADFKGDAQSQREFFDALITEVGIPACDASSKEAGYLTLNLTPEYTRDVKASGTFAVAKSEQKLWLPSNFKLEIDGLDCTRVNKIDAFTVKQTVVTDDIGDSRDYEREPGRVEFPNLKVTFAEVSAQSWISWHKDFLIDGNSGQEQEKNGRLVFLSPTLTEELLEIKFFNLGIFSLKQEKAESNSDAIKRMVAELYCERMEFNYKVGAIA